MSAGKWEQSSLMGKYGGDIDYRVRGELMGWITPHTTNGARSMALSSLWRATVPRDLRTPEGTDTNLVAFDLTKEEAMRLVEVTVRLKGE